MARGADLNFFRTHRKARISLLVLFLVTGCRAQGQPQSCTPDPSLNTTCSSASSTPCGQFAQCSEDQQQVGQYFCSCCTNFFSPSGTNTDCRSTTEADPSCSGYDSQCIYCGSTFQGPCQKCTNNVQDGGCVDNCPGSDAINYHITSIANTSLSARTCNEGSSGGSTTLPQWAIIVIPVMATVILLICIVFVGVFTFTILNRSSSGQFDVEDQQRETGDRVPLRPPQSKFSKQNADGYVRDSAAFEDTDDVTGDEALFRQKLNDLRAYAEVFLRMLNDMRRRLKELPAEAPAAVQYRNVMRDVTRLLYLLNKKPNLLEMPPDGMHLLNWSNQILQRYLASQGQSFRGSNRISAIGDQTETQF